MVIWRQCPFEQLLQCKEILCSLRCTENRRCTNTMQHSRVTERHGGIEVAWLEQKKGGGRRGGRAEEARMGQGDGEKGSKRKLEVKEFKRMSSQEAMGKC